MKNENHFFAFRGKSDRRRKRDSIKQKQRNLIELYKKEKHLSRLYRNLGLEELEHPYQKGFKRTFVLRDDQARSKKADFYLELLKYINTTQHSLRKDFKKKKRKYRKRIYTETEQRVRRLTIYQFCKVPEMFRQQFAKVEHYNMQRKCFEIRYIFIEPWRYVLKVEPNMITHRRKVDAALNSERDQLENYIERNCLRPAINKALGRTTNYKEWKVPDKYKQEPIFNILKQANEQH